MLFYNMGIKNVRVSCRVLKKKKMYVDDLLLRGLIVQEVQYCKVCVIEIFDDLSFILYKWFFNVV